MKWRVAVVLASFAMLATAFGAVASTDLDTETPSKMNALNSYLMAKSELDSQAMKGVVPSTMDVEGAFTYVEGPYPRYHDDGSPPGPDHMPWGSHYVSDVMYTPPHNPGGWNSMDATGGVGHFAVGATHESWIGDQNGDGEIQWVVGFSYRPWGEDGIDNDGDGCIDEKTYWQWDPARGVNCDMIPDQITYYETGGMADAGGDDGDLLINVDWYSNLQVSKLWRAFVSPRWMGYQIRGFLTYPQAAGEFFSYYAHESSNQVNANPEMDNDMNDMYVGNIDARGFPARAPVNRICAAGSQLYMGITFKREDGWVVTSFELNEYYDGHDWNGDGDAIDRVAAYYSVDPLGSNCRENVVNSGVVGVYPRNSGKIMSPGYTSESSDRRDWNFDGDTFDYVLLYHNISTTWAMKGKVYTSFTFTASVPAWGFGWTAVYSLYGQFQTFPLKFGVAFYKYEGAALGYYHTYFSLVSDEDGDWRTMLPQYHVGYGQPSATPNSVCIQIYAREIYLNYAGIKLMNNMADGNGDGDYKDTLNYVFCPDEFGGGGEYIVENTSKYAKGLYQYPIPFITLGYTYYSADGTDSNGLCILPFFYDENSLHDDADGNLVVEYSYYHVYYWIDIDNLAPGFVPGHTKTNHENSHNRPTGHPYKMTYPV